VKHVEVATILRKRAGKLHLHLHLFVQEKREIQFSKTFDSRTRHTRHI